jgi:hypothetical protein
MAELVVLVLDNPDQAEEVLTAWLEVGIGGATILDSAGLRYKIGRRNMRDDLPLIPSLRDLLQGREEPHCTLFAVVPDGFDLDGLVTATEGITGALDEPDTGILFVIPVTRVWGLNRKPI